MGNLISSFKPRERKIGFIKLRPRRKLTVDIVPDFEPQEIIKHSFKKNLLECTGTGCQHCIDDLSKEYYYRIMVLETVSSGKVEQYIDLSAYNFDMFQQINEMVDIEKSNPFTFDCEQYESGNSYHLKKSDYENRCFIEEYSDMMKEHTELDVDEEKNTDSDDMEFDFSDMDDD